MAATFRSASSGTGSAPTAVPKPAGVEAGDLLLAFINEDSFGGTPVPPSAPSGWELLKSINILTGAGAVNSVTYIFSHRAGASEPSTYTWGLDSSAVVGMVALKGALEIAEIAIATSGTTTVTTINAPSVAAAADDSLLIVGMATGQGTQFAMPGGVTEALDVRVSNAANQMSMAVGYQAVAAGATGTRLLTNSNTYGNGADQAIAFSLAITPGTPPQPPEWDLSLDSGLTDEQGAKSFLGVLRGELYLFGSSGESAGAMEGIHRFRAGAWEQLYEGGGEDFNGMGAYGAMAYNGKLYVGDRRKGRLYRLDLDGEGDFEALTSVGGEGFVGTEDVFPGPVLWGRLYLGTFGNAFNPGLGLEPPGIYRFDGATVTQILELADIEVGGEVSSLTYFEGKLWASAVNADRDYCEVWTVEEDDTTSLAYSGSTIYTLAVLGGQLVGATLENDEAAPGAESEFVVWDGSAFDPLAGPWPVQLGSEFCKAIGGQLWGSDYYNGITAYDGEGTENIGMGAWVNDPLASSEASEAFGGVLCVKVSGSYVWVTTQQPVKVWRTPAPAVPTHVSTGSALVPAIRSVYDGSKLVEA